MSRSKLMFILFIIIPFTELWLLVSFSAQFGFLTTLLIIVASAALGVRQLKDQGRELLSTAQRKLATGEMPDQEIQQGILVALAGVLLITPGLLTDMLGLLLLFPPSRLFLLRHITKYIVLSGLHRQSTTQTPNDTSATRPTIIDGEYERKD